MPSMLIFHSFCIVVFSKSYCPYCKSSKALLSENGAKYFLMELDQVGMSYLSLFYIGVMLTGTLEDGAAIQDALEDMTHQRSVPNIFIKQQHIGGNSDLQAKRSELPALLEAAGAI
jgi:glutaredoxin 3